MPKCASLPSQVFSPPSISRRECARPNWQNSIATNCPQLENPFAACSARVSLTIRSNSIRGNSLSIWLNMLHDAFTLGLLGSDRCAFGDAPATLHLRMAQLHFLFRTRVGQTTFFRKP